MITVITHFVLPRPITTEEARNVFLSTAPTYQGVPGLVRKVYFASEDGSTAGGIYLWRSRADADLMYTDQWKVFVREKYGVNPSVIYLNSPVIVDNLTNEILAQR